MEWNLRFQDTVDTVETLDIDIAFIGILKNDENLLDE